MKTSELPILDEAMSAIKEAMLEDMVDGLNKVKKLSDPTNDIDSQ